MADLFISWKKTATQKEKQCNEFSFSHMLRHASNSTTWHCSQTICSSRIGLVKAKCEGKDTVKRSDIKAQDELRSRWSRGNTTSPESHTAATNEEQQERVTGLTQMTPLRA